LAESDPDLTAEVLEDLREAGFDLELAGIVAAIDNDDANAPLVPRMARALIGRPKPRYCLGKQNAD